MQYEIVRYCAAFKSQVVKLQTHLWGTDLGLNSACLEWKYEQNPYMDAPLIYVALCGQEVVGMRGFFGARWEIGNPSQTFLGPCACDLVVDPEHRRRGVFRKIMHVALNDIADRGYSYVFNMSGNQKTVRGSLAQGWRSLGSLQPMRWKAEQKSISCRMQKYARKLPFVSSDKSRPPFYFLDKNGARDQHKASLHVSVELTPRPQAMAELIQRIHSDGRIRHVRDQKYFAWRFLNPRRSYRFLFWEDDDLEGYLVLQMRKPHEKELRAKLVDWEATNSQVRADLLQTTIRWGHFDSLDIWSATLQKEAQSLLQNIGFKRMEDSEDITPKPPTVLIRPVLDEMLNTDWVIANRRLLDLDNWDLRMTYSDGS